MRYFSVISYQFQSFQRTNILGLLALLLVISSCRTEVASGIRIHMSKSLSAVSLPVQPKKKKQVIAHRRQKQQKDSIQAMQDSIDLNRSRMVFTFVSYGG